MNRLSDYQTFLTQFLRNYETTGSVIPSGRALASALCRHVGAGGAQKILEAGPGTGAVTGCIIDRMRQRRRVVDGRTEFDVCRSSAQRVQDRSRRFDEVESRCHLIEGSVQQLGQENHFDIVISGLPLNNFSSEDVRIILQAYAKLLKPGGILSFFQYILIRPAKMFVSVGSERSRLKGVGDAIEGMLGEREFAREWVWVNVPPAWVHHIRF